MTTTFVGHFLGPNVHASRPAAAGLPEGTMYVCTTHAKIERVVAAAWVDYATLGSGVTVSTDGIWDSKGDLAAASGPDAAAKLAVGSNGQVLTADSTQTLGVKWAAPAAAEKVVQLKVLDDATALTAGDGKLIFACDDSMNGLNLVDADMYVTTVSSSGLPTVQIRNVTDSVDMLTTKISIDASEFTSYTAAAAAVIDTAHDDVATGDLIAIDVDVAGTGAKGLGIILSFA